MVVLGGWGVVVHVVCQALSEKWSEHGINGVPHYNHSAKRFSWVAPVAQEPW